jgi:Leu/Phe-tRNA-protein transferase
MPAGSRSTTPALSLLLLLLLSRQLRLQTIMSSRQPQEEITTDLLLQAYRCGIFPMAESADDPALHWYEPKRRGILPLDVFHVSRSLGKTLRAERFEVVASTL